MLSLSAIANVLPNGQVRGNKVVASGPEAASHKVRWKQKRRTVTVYINGDDIGVNCHHPDQEPIDVKDWVRRLARLPAYQRSKKPTAPPPPFKITNQFLGESLAIARYRGRITFDQFCLIVNDLRPTDRHRREFARYYGLELGITDVDLAMGRKRRCYTADERASIWGLTYAERQFLGLRRTGAVDLDKSGRERARRDRYNAKRRAKRAEARKELSGSIEVSRSSGVNRVLPSLEGSSNNSNSNRITETPMD